jgi:DnaK suppressor protein
MVVPPGEVERAHLSQRLAEISGAPDRARGSSTRHHGLVDPNLAQSLLTLLKERRQRALKRRDALTADFDDIVERSSDASRDDEHDPEGATIAFERAQVTALAAAAEQELTDVDRAVERVHAGLHDRCETCGGEIPAARLHARPTARTCVGCARTDAADP